MMSGMKAAVLYGPRDLRVDEVPDPTILAPGMLITVEPVVYDQTGIYCIEEMVLVTEDGHEVLSGAPRELSSL